MQSENPNLHEELQKLYVFYPLRLLHLSYWHSNSKYSFIPVGWSWCRFGWILGSSRCATAASHMAGVQRQMDEWGRHDAIAWLCHSSDIAPKEQLWWIMYQCISCCPRYRQVWEEIPEETIYWQITELAHADLYSLLIILEWCEMLRLTSYLHLKKRCWKGKNWKGFNSSFLRHLD